MSIVALILLALAMSVDAFTVALAKGATMRHTTLAIALKAGVVFGVVEMITPIVGWGFGRLAADYVSGIDHWIAFVLLVGLGLHLLYDAIFVHDDEMNDDEVNDKVNDKTTHQTDNNTPNQLPNRLPNQLPHQSNDTPNNTLNDTPTLSTSNPKKILTHPTVLLIITAFATSIDAMAMGVSLAFLQVNIWLAAVLIGLATTVMATLGILLGHKLNERIGKWAEIVGAMVLIMIGVWILYHHLAA